MPERGTFGLLSFFAHRGAAVSAPEASVQRRARKSVHRLPDAVTKAGTGCATRGQCAMTGTAQKNLHNRIGV